MIGAIVRNDIVENLIVIQDGQVSEMEAALGCEIVDARPYGLCVGDLRTAAGWTRNAGGEQMILPPLAQESYDSYSVMAKRAAETEAAAEEAAQQEAAAQDELADMHAALEILGVNVDG